jgi:hypothetical protein
LLIPIGRERKERLPIDIMVEEAGGRTKGQVDSKGINPKNRVFGNRKSLFRVSSFVIRHGELVLIVRAKNEMGVLTNNVSHLSSR